MERLWQERADYGHFFYRIPNGESAADAYDRISGFNESLWRQFGYDDFPSVCVLVTHGLMGRVFLMKWYKWTVEYFEDLRNIHHCEFLVMEKDDNGKYDLKTTLRTWSELHSRKTGPPSPKLPPRRWGGCPDGCNHHKTSFTKRVKRTSTMDLTSKRAASPPPIAPLALETDDHPIAVPDDTPTTPSRQKSTKKFTALNLLHEYEIRTAREPTDTDAPAPSDSEDDIEDVLTLPARRRKASLALLTGRDGGGSHSGMPSPTDGASSDAEDDGEQPARRGPHTAQSNGAGSSYRSEGWTPMAVLPEHPDQPATEPGRRSSVRFEQVGVEEKSQSASKENEFDLLSRGVEEDEDEPAEGTAAADIY
jgi:Histidine phosphatase superfamily (branch 1)